MPATPIIKVLLLSIKGLSKSLDTLLQFYDKHIGTKVKRKDISDKGAKKFTPISAC